MDLTHTHEQLSTEHTLARPVVGHAKHNQMEIYKSSRAFSFLPRTRAAKGRMGLRLHTDGRAC